jgi:hypothetical protein
LLTGADHVAFHERVEPDNEEVEVNDVTSPGTVTTGEETVAVLENASVEPPTFVAVTRQRIGLTYMLLKFDGGE